MCVSLVFLPTIENFFVTINLLCLDFLMALPITQSFVWFQDGFNALKRYPAAMLSILGANATLLMVLPIIPFIGSLLASIWLPFGTFLAATATFDAIDGIRPTYESLKRALRDERIKTHFFALGVFSAIATEVIQLLALWLMKLHYGVPMDQVLDMYSQSMQNFENIPYLGLVVGILFITIVTMINLFAPLLIARAGQDYKEAAFYAFMGSLKNAGVLLVSYVMPLLACAGITAGLILALPSIGLFVAPFLTLALVIFSQTLTWPAYRDIFVRK